MITDLYTVEESRSQAFQDAITRWPGRYDVYAVWQEFGIGPYTDTFQRKTDLLKDPIIHILQKVGDRTLYMLQSSFIYPA